MLHQANEQILTTDENLGCSEMLIKQRCLEGTAADCTRVICVPEVMELEMFLGQYRHCLKRQQRTWQRVGLIILRSEFDPCLPQLA